jgi:hypothetical protein
MSRYLATISRSFPAQVDTPHLSPITCIITMSRLFAWNEDNVRPLVTEALAGWYAYRVCEGYVAGVKHTDRLYRQTRHH